MVLGAQQPHNESAQKVSAVILHLEGNKVTLHLKKQNSQVIGRLGTVRKKMEAWKMVEVSCLFSLLKIKCTGNLINYLLNN